MLIVKIHQLLNRFGELLPEGRLMHKSRFLACVRGTLQVTGRDSFPCFFQSTLFFEPVGFHGDVVNGKNGASDGIGPMAILMQRWKSLDKNCGVCVCVFNFS